jgi:hypothetical protein
MAEMEEKKVSETKPMLNLKELGKSGTLVTSKQIDDEYLNELKGVDGQKLYEKMLRSDSQIRKLFHAVNNPIRSAKWDIEPASDDPKDLEVAALIRHILFKNLPDGWKAKLDEILTFPWHGHAVFEVVHQNRNEKPYGPYTGLKNIAFRDQRTLTEWAFKDGILETVKQEQAGDLEVNVELPISALILFFNEKKGDDLGFPFLRMLYGNYKRKLLYKQLQAIGIERAALPVPHLQIPSEVSPDSEEWALAEEQLRAFTQAESSYFMMPHGYELKFNQTNTFNPSHVQVAIKAENEEIAGSLVAMFLEMGIGGNSGNQAGTEVSAAFFRDGIEYLADKVTETFNLKLIPSLVRLNYGDTVEVMPSLVHDGITDQAGEEIMRIITGYVKDGVIHADEPLEDHVRKIHSLPKKAEGSLADNQTSSDDPKPGKKKAEQEVETEEDEEDEVELNDKTRTIDFSAKPNEVQKLMSTSAKKISEVIRASLEFSGNKFIVDTLNRAKQLPDDKKQKATDKVIVGGSKKFKDALKAPLAEAASLAIESARKEIPSKKDVELKTVEKDLIRLSEKYGDISEIKLNDLSKLPGYMQVLIAKQADLISQHSLDEMKARLSFTYSSIDLKSKDMNVVKQNMEESLSEFIASSQVAVKGENVAALMVNEGRSSFFFDEDVLEEIHSFTFMNRDPKSPICKELAGVTFNTNDAESLRYSPPLHHNCKSFLRANLKKSNGVKKLEVKTLSPTPEAVKSITL